MSANARPAKSAYARFNRAVTFLPQTSADTRPCLTVAGVQVYAYIDEEGGLRISVDLENAESVLIDAQDTVSVRMRVMGRRWTAD